MLSLLSYYPQIRHLMTETTGSAGVNNQGIAE